MHRLFVLLGFTLLVLWQIATATYSDGTLSLHEENIGIKYSSSHLHLNKFIIVDENSIVNAILAYAVCDRTCNNSVKNCTAYHESTVTKVSCPVQLIARQNATIDSENIRVVPFGKNKAIVSWMDRSEVDGRFWRHRVVHYDNCSVFKVDETRLRGMKDVTFVSYNDYFDAIGYDDETCSKNYCKIRFDDKGQVLMDRQSWLFDIVPPIAHKQLQLLPVKGDNFLLVEEFQRISSSVPTLSGHVALVRSDGMSKICNILN